MTLVVGVLLNLLNYFLLTENLDSDCRPPNIGSKFDFQGGVWEIFITFRTAKICEGATSGLKKRSSFDRNIKQNGSKLKSALYLWLKTQSFKNMLRTFFIKKLKSFRNTQRVLFVLGKRFRSSDIAWWAIWERFLSHLGLLVSKTQFISILASKFR